MPGAGTEQFRPVKPLRLVEGVRAVAGGCEDAAFAGFAWLFWVVDIGCWEIVLRWLYRQLLP